MDDNSLIGSVVVEVKADLAKLVADFSRGKAQTQAFAQDMSKVTTASKLSAAEQLSLAQSFNTLSQRYDPLKDKMQRYIADAETIRKINSSGLFNAAELERLNTGFAALAPQSLHTADSVATLKSQLGGLVQQYQPLKIAQAKYASDLDVVAKAQKAGLIGNTEAIALQGAMGRAFEDTEKKIEGETVGLEGWARSTEHHLRAFRLLLSFVGVDLALRFGEFVTKTLESTAALGDEARALGLTTAELQGYHAMARQVGMATGEMDSAFATLGHNIDDLRLGKVGPFSKMMVKFFGDTGAAAEQLKPLNQIFLDLIDKFGRVGDEAQKKGAMVIAFGDAANKMGQMTDIGSSGIKSLADQMRQMGLILSEKQIADADETAKKLDVLWQSLKIQFADNVVKNAKAIDQLAHALITLSTITLQRVVAEIGALVDRIAQLANGVNTLLKLVPSIRGGGIWSQTQQVSKDIGGFDEKGHPTGLVKRFLDSNDVVGQIKQVMRDMGLASGSTSITVPLPGVTMPQKQKPKGSNIDLSGLLSPKPPHEKKPPKEKFDQFQQDEEQEQLRQLQLMREATGGLVEQNAIDHKIIEKQLEIRDQQIDRAVHNKEMTAKEGEQLKKDAAITAAMETEKVDREMRIADIERQNAFADEMNQLVQDGLQTARVMARTDKERKDIDLAILDARQAQARDEIDKQIAIAEENHDQQKINNLMIERAKLLANQNAEIKNFDIEHLLPIQQYERLLPSSSQELGDATHAMAFDKFNEKLQQAAQFAGDVGDAFGKAASALARGAKPIDVFTGLISDLADTFTKNFIEKPISDLVTEKLGKPLAQQAFGSQLNKLAVQAGGAALSTQQMNTAIILATGSLNALASAAAAAAAAQGAGGIVSGSGGAGGLLSLLGSAGGGLDFSGGFGSLASGTLASSGMDFSSVFAGFGAGFATGGFTGDGADTDVAGHVHRNEWVFDAKTTKKLRPILPLLTAFGAGSAPNFGGNASDLKRMGSDGPQPLHVQFGDLVFPGVTDARTARQSASQATSTIHRKLTRVVRKGMSTQ